MFWCFKILQFFRYSILSLAFSHKCAQGRDKLLEKSLRCSCSYLNVIVLIWMCLVLLTLIMSFLPIQNWKLSFRYLISNPMCDSFYLNRDHFYSYLLLFLCKWLCDIPHRISGKLRNSKASPNSLCLPQPSISIRLWKLVYSFYSFFTTQEREGPDSKRVRLLWKGKTPFPIMLVS